MQPIRVAITGASGKIGSTLMYWIASGALFGEKQPVILHLLEVPDAIRHLNGALMELEDCAFPALKDVIISDAPDVVFRDVEFVFMVGARPRQAGMERKDLIRMNSEIFKSQGEALNRVASRDVRVVVVANPANTNALVVIKNAPDLDPSRVTALTRLDHNRALAHLAKGLDCHVNQIRRVTIWGNHSPTQFPDISRVQKGGEVLNDELCQRWYEHQYLPLVRERGSEIIKLRGISSVESAAASAIEHMRSWIEGTPTGDWVSMGIYSASNPYGFDEDLVFSMPVICADGKYQVVEGIEFDDFARKQIWLTEAELIEERQQVEHLLVPNQQISAG